MDYPCAMDFRYDGPADAPVRFLFAHGAGAPMDSPFMDAIAAGVAAAGHRVCRFEFPYMAKRRLDGKRRGPDRAQVLSEHFLEATDAERHDGALFIGGKSMGGRYASMLCDDAGVSGVICLGYPFHPPGKPERTRVAHLADLKTPGLIVQGSRDSLGNREDVAGYTLASGLEVTWLEDGDHSFKPRKRSGRTETQAWQEAIEAINGFIRRIAS